VPIAMPGVGRVVHYRGWRVPRPAETRAVSPRAAGMR